MEEILSLRKKIDELDSQILKLLNERVEISKKIGLRKKELNIPIADLQREDEVYRRVTQKAAELGLDTSKISWIYREIIAMCTDAQEGTAASGV